MKTQLLALILGFISLSTQAGPRDFLECRFYNHEVAINPSGIRNFTTDDSELLTLEKTAAGKLFQVTYSGSLETLKIKFCVDQECSTELVTDSTKGLEIILTEGKRVSCNGFEG